ncbi:MAG: hypothetical protein WCO63_16145 [Bacteroidota bacterium]
MELSPQQKIEIEKLSGVGYNPKEIALIMELSPLWIEIQNKNPDSEFRHHYDRGILMKEAERDKNTSDAAKNGSITAVQHLEAKLRQRKLSDLREKIVNGHN